MSTTTTNHGLIRPELTDILDNTLAAIGSSNDTIDAELTALADAVDTLNLGKDTTLAAESLSGTLLSGAMLAAGAIVEQGSNANGAYWRWESGLQVCRHSMSAASNLTTAHGSVFRTSSTVWNYPAAFNVAPSMSAMEGSGIGFCWGGLGSSNVEASSGSFSIVGGISTAAMPTARLIAIGSWK